MMRYPNSFFVGPPTLTYKWEVWLSVAVEPALDKWQMSSPFAYQ